MSGKKSAGRQRIADEFGLFGGVHNFLATDETEMKHK
jgi:hypothetical protein